VPVNWAGQYGHNTGEDLPGNRCSELAYSNRSLRVKMAVSPHSPFTLQVLVGAGPGSVL
jgi:hypothetical protein